MTAASPVLRRAPIPPPLPPATLEVVAGRGELFCRRVEGPRGAPTVVLIHGWMASADLNWYPLFGPLGQHHPVIAPDLRGHGRSMLPEDGFSIDSAADDIAALLEAGGSAPVIAVGYSLGTAVAQSLADRHPHLVSAMVLAAGEFAPARQMHKKVLLRAGGLHGWWLRLTTGRWLGHRIIDRARRTNPAVDELRPWLVAELERGHPGSLRAAGRSLGRFDSGVVAARCDAPAVIVLTTEDRLVKPRVQQRLAEAWDAEVVLLLADHDAPIAKPEPFVVAMLEAIERAAHLGASVTERAVS